MHSAAIFFACRAEQSRRHPLERQTAFPGKAAAAVIMRLSIMALSAAAANHGTIRVPDSLTGSVVCPWHRIGYCHPCSDPGRPAATLGGPASRATVTGGCSFQLESECDSHHDIYSDTVGRHDLCQREDDLRLDWGPKRAGGGPRPWPQPGRTRIVKPAAPAEPGQRPLARHSVAVTQLSHHWHDHLTVTQSSLE